MDQVKAPLPLAGNIRYLRKQLRLSQAALGEQVGLSRSNIASYENAKAEPRAAKLAELAQYFQVSLERLITGSFEGDPPPGSRSESFLQVQGHRDVRRQLAGFEERNMRLKQILHQLTEQQSRSMNSSAADAADLNRIVTQFEGMLAIMQELLRNDEELVGVIHAATITETVLG